MATISDTTRRNKESHSGWRTICCRYKSPATFYLCFFYSIALWSAEPAKDFHQAYERWKERMVQPDMRESSGPGRTDCREYRDIVGLGAKELPAIISKMEDAPNDPLAQQLWVAVARISKKRFEKEEIRSVSNNVDRVFIWLTWWKEGRFETGDRFTELYEQWKSSQSQKKDLAAQETLQKIVELGIPVLPYLIDEVEREPGLASAFSQLTDQAIPPTATASECKEWWNRNKNKYELPPRSE
jgi:hypothetical protein